MLTFTYTKPDVIYTSLNEINDSCPGIYVFRNNNKDCLYVGKAEELKSRMHSYKYNGSHLGKDFFKDVKIIEIYFVPVYFLECYEIMMINYLNPIYNAKDVLMNHNVCIDYEGLKRAYGDDIINKIKDIEEVYRNKIKKISVNEMTIEVEKKKFEKQVKKQKKRFRRKTPIFIQKQRTSFV